MAAELHINDSATWRKMREVHVNDVGTWRRIKSVHVNDSGTWRQVFTDGFSITAGTFLNNVGWESTIPYGSTDPSPAVLPDGKVVEALHESSSTNIVFRVSGLLSDPGQSYFTSITANGNTLTSASATSYAYNAGSQSSQWNWSIPAVFGFVNGNQYQVVVV